MFDRSSTWSSLSSGSEPVTPAPLTRSSRSVSTMRSCGITVSSSAAIVRRLMPWIVPSSAGIGPFRSATTTFFASSVSRLSAGTDPSNRRSFTRPSAERSGSSTEPPMVSSYRSSAAIDVGSVPPALRRTRLRTPARSPTASGTVPPPRSSSSAVTCPSTQRNRTLHGLSRSGNTPALIRSFSAAQSAASSASERG